MKPRVLIVEDITEPGKQFLRENGYDLIISSDTSVEAIKRDIECCDAVLSKTILLTREILESAKNLKVIGKHGAGIDNVVNINDANELGIYVVNTPYANSKSVAEFTIGFSYEQCGQEWRFLYCRKSSRGRVKWEKAGLDRLGKYRETGC